MLNQHLVEAILTIGCAYKHPKGGIAQVLYNYEQYVFPHFKCITNSGDANKFKKLIKAIGGLIQMGYRLSCDRNIGIVHIHTASYNSFKRSSWFVLLAKLFRKKVILHIHGGGFKEYYATNPQWIISVLDKCDVIITLSVSWKQFYQSITCCPHIFIVENIISPPVLKQVGKSDDRFHLLFLGLVDRQKGIFDLLETMHEYIEVFRNKLVLHIGGNGQIYILREMIAQYELNDIVTYEGFVSGTRKTDLLLGCDAFILPSYTEGLPVSILEAMSYGKPILSTPVGGIPEVVEQNVNGILFQPGDKKAMIEAIELIMNDEKKRTDMGQKSHERMKPFLPENVERQLDSIYRKLLHI